MLNLMLVNKKEMDDPFLRDLTACIQMKQKKLNEAAAAAAAAAVAESVTPPLVTPTMAKTTSPPSIEQADMSKNSKQFITLNMPSPAIAANLTSTKPATSKPTCELSKTASFNKPSFNFSLNSTSTLKPNEIQTVSRATSPITFSVTGRANPSVSTLISANTFTVLVKSAEPKSLLDTGMQTDLVEPEEPLKIRQTQPKISLLKYEETPPTPVKVETNDLFKVIKAPTLLSIKPIAKQTCEEQVVKAKPFQLMSFSLSKFLSSFLTLIRLYFIPNLKISLFFDRYYFSSNNYSKFYEFNFTKN